MTHDEHVLDVAAAMNRLFDMTKEMPEYSIYWGETKTTNTGHTLTKAEDLASWWRNTAEDEINKIAPKVEEYGSTDLELVGEALLMMLPHLRKKVAPAELGIAFYLLGKVGRIIGAYADGHAPSDDTWHDTGVYARMAQRVRHNNGTWG